MNLIPGLEQFTLTFDPSTEPDVVTGGGYEVFAVPAAELVNNDFVPSVSNRVYKGPDTSITVKAAAGIWAVKAAAYDVFGDTGLNYTPLMTCEVVSRVTDMLNELTGSITEDQLYQDLARRIDLIDTPVTGLVDMTDAIRTKVQDPVTGLEVQTARLVEDIHDPATGLIKKVDAVEVIVSDPDTGLVKKFDVLDATVNDPATGVLAKVSGLDASINDPDTGVVARQAELEQVVLDPANGIAKVTQDLQAAVGDDHAALQVEQSVRAAVTAPEWVAGSYPKGATVLVSVAGHGYLFQSKVDSNTAAPTVTNGVAVETAQWKPVTANLYAQMMLKTDVNGHVVGIGLANDGVTGEVAILAPKFKVVNPDLPEESMQVFTVGTIGGQPTVGIDGTLVLDGTLVVGGNVEMGPNAVIEWSNLSDESKTNLTGPEGPTGPSGPIGPQGPDGLSVVWKGNLAAAPANPVKNWAYRNTGNGVVYIYNGTSWVLMVLDGSDGVDGAPGANGLSVFITYHDNPLSSTPATPTGDGTSGGWHTNATAAVVWISQKVAASSTSGTWGVPIPIKGSQGIQGIQGPPGPTPDMTDYLDKATWITEVGADYLFTGKIAADNILGNVITGKTIQTAATGKRIFMDYATDTIQLWTEDGFNPILLGYTASNHPTTVAGTVAKINVSAPEWLTTTGLTIDAYLGSALKVTNSGNAPAVYALANGAGSSAAGLFGVGFAGSCGVYGYNASSGEGVRGVSDSGFGVHGVSASGTAGSFESTGGIGVQGNSASSYGLVGANLNGNTYDIYAAGAGSNYGPFTGAHDALAEEEFTGAPGDIVVDQEMLIKKGISSTLGVVRLSDAPADKKVVGVVAIICAANDPHLPAIVGQNQYALQLLEGTRSLIVNALGEGQINVCRDGGDIEAGDYLCSSARPGKAMKQADDLLHNYTVAKAREPVLWLEGEDDIRQIACTYHCG